MGRGACKLSGRNSAYLIPQTWEVGPLGDVLLTIELLYGLVNCRHIYIHNPLDLFEREYLQNVQRLPRELSSFLHNDDHLPSARALQCRRDWLPPSQLASLVAHWTNDLSSMLCTVMMFMVTVVHSYRRSISELGLNTVVFISNVANSCNCLCCKGKTLSIMLYIRISAITQGYGGGQGC